MSADNGIYILQAKDGYRVTHAQAIDNLNWWPEDSGYREELNPQVVYDYFHASKVFSTKEEALKEAWRLYDGIEEDGLPIEYGVSPIHGMEDKDFPTEGTKEQQNENYKDH